MTEQEKRCVSDLRNVSHAQCQDYSVYTIALSRRAAYMIEKLSLELERVTRSRDEWERRALDAESWLAVYKEGFDE